MVLRSEAVPISIHSLRKEGDCYHMDMSERFSISIHSLRKEGDYVYIILPIEHKVFQSTPSARRETTKSHCKRSASVPNFNPLPPQGGRQINSFGCLIRICISIHSLRKEGDTLAFWTFSGVSCYFNPLPPQGGRRRSQAQRALTT